MQDNRILLNDSEKNRYNRQMIMFDWGEEGQIKLKKATVFIAGAGGLGSSVAIYLASAGVGCIRICDSGKVELSNLNRQILYTDDDIGKKKVLSAAQTLSKVNPNIKIVHLFEKIEKRNISELAGNAQIIIDCLDNFQTRYIVNEYAVNAGRPFIHTGVYGMAGQITFIFSPETPCLECIFPDAPPPEILPVVGTTAGIMGCLEAQETLKYLTGRGTLLKNRLIVLDGDNLTFEELHLEKSPSCKICSSKFN